MRVSIIVLSLILILGLTGCGSSSDKPKNTDSLEISSITETSVPSEKIEDTIAPEEAQYLIAVEAFEAGDFKNAETLFQEQEDYKDSKGYLKKLSMLLSYQGEWKTKTHTLIISGWECHNVFYSSSNKNEVSNIHTFYLTLNDNGSLTVSNSSAQAREMLSINEDGELIETDIISNNDDTTTYTWVSDSMDVPIKKEQPKIGMTKEQVYASSWGFPTKRNTTTTAYGVTEQWVYSKGYIYFENEIVTAIQER